MHIPLLDLKLQYASIRDEVEAALGRVLADQLFILGPEVEALEREIADYCHCARGVGVSSGTDALSVALTALGVGPGDEVVTTPFTFFATAGSIARLGARPVFVDIEPDTYNLDPDRLEKAVTGKTRAVVPVHLYGQMADMDPILEIAGRHGLPVVEDAAQAIGAEHRGRRAGSLGAVGCISFYPSKNLGACGEGGMVVTGDPRLADEMEVLRNQGQRDKYVHQRLGGNFRLDAMQAAVLRVKLRRLDAWNAARRAHADLYRRLLTDAGLTGKPDSPVRAPVEAAGRSHVYHLFVIAVDAGDRADLTAWLRQAGIGCETYYPVPAHLQECLGHLGYRPGDLPVSEAAARETLALPVFPELTRQQIETVVERLAAFFAGRPRRQRGAAAASIARG